MSVAGDVASGLVAIYIVDKVTGKRKRFLEKGVAHQRNQGDYLVRHLKRKQQGEENEENG